jgi:pimeloyl-ACP methyl ester carboxylesterase
VAARAARIRDAPAVRELFTAMVDTTFPYAERRAGTTLDAGIAADLAGAPLALDRITAPTLVVHGTRDGDVPFADGEHAAATIPGAEHHWMVDEDHLGFWLGPGGGAAQDAVRGFLARHAPRPWS